MSTQWKFMTILIFMLERDISLDKESQVIEYPMFQVLVFLK